MTDAGRQTFFLPLALLVCLACTHIRGVPQSAPARMKPPPVAELDHVPLDPDQVRCQPEGITVTQNWILDIYTLFHSRRYRGWRVTFPGSGGEERVAHLLVPNGAGRHPLVIVYPILKGSQIVSEGMAKALIHHGYAVARLERHDLDLEQATSPDAPARTFRHAILDGRRLLDWLLTREDLDARRVAAAGVSTGALLALDLLAVDPRVTAGFFLMVGGNLPEVLYDSSEKPLQIFRKRIQASYDLRTREAWIDFMKPYLEVIDPIQHADRIDADQVLLISGRFDHVIRPVHTTELWEALGRPEWRRFPGGHYEFFPFFWWAIGRGAEHLDRWFEKPSE